MTVALGLLFLEKTSLELSTDASYHELLPATLPACLPLSPLVQKYFILFIYFWLYPAACGILVPRPGIEPVAPAVEAESPNRWTIREFLSRSISLACGYDGLRL